MENMMNLKMNKNFAKSKSDLLSVFISNNIDSNNSSIAFGSIAIFISAAVFISSVLAASATMATTVEASVLISITIISIASIILFSLKTLN